MFCHVCWQYTLEKQSLRCRLRLVGEYTQNIIDYTKQVFQRQVQDRFITGSNVHLFKWKYGEKIYKKTMKITLQGANEAWCVQLLKHVSCNPFGIIHPGLIITHFCVINGGINLTFLLKKLSQTFSGIGEILGLVPLKEKSKCF